ncbi:MULTISPECIES: NYN domain-containing protein [unclassified Variovorax]|uniref:NYN domain-containing protein n=1 Tax=unclassified Variovorax TaxID=663243 RepID=UPI00210BE7F5|nr:MULTISPECIES: NYN domain-containing protein [unclassified Variovorax]
MNDMPKVMLLIDADNVSADVMEQAVHKVLAEHGHLHVRRAYCTAEVALKHQLVFKRLGVRPMVNLAAGKNSTDIALAVDAMDLAVSERPQVVYLVSSDSDFAPLVIRLREKGCRVCGIGQQGKTGDETTTAYDEFTDLQHHGKGDRPAAAAAPSMPAARTAGRKTAAKAAKSGAASDSPAKTPRAKAAPASKKAKTAAKKSAKASAASEAAEFILQAVPALRGGNEVALNDIAQALRAAKLLGKRASSIKLFEQLPAEFAVLQHPDRIRWIGTPAP